MPSVIHSLSVIVSRLETGSLAMVIRDSEGGPHEHELYWNDSGSFSTCRDPFSGEYSGIGSYEKDYAELS